MRQFFALIFLYILFFSSCSKNETIETRKSINFDTQWKFHLGDTINAQQINFDDSNWRTLNVPHDWSIEGEYNVNNPMGGQCGYLPAGIGWYRKTIKVPKNWKNKHVEISFDGVYMNSTVWANGIKLGNRPYGWISFAYDISDVVSTSNEITFAVRVDNNAQPSARWYTGSGIYAHTWIDIKQKQHIAKDGIFIKTEQNNVSVETEFSENLDGELVTSILNNKGEEVASTTTKIRSNSKVNTELLVPSPKLWSVENPNLYTLKSILKIDNNITDVVETKFGIRDIVWKPETGMWLNGENVKLQGVCNHQDAGALGAAVPDKILRFRIQQLKDMGVNAIRTAHNPQTPIFYEICDELGMLVMDEIFDGWKRKAKNDYGAHFFNEWWQQDLTDWIKRDRNHPSIVIYSVGNETSGIIGKDLVETCNTLDPTRPVTSGHSGSQFMNVLGVNGGSEKRGYIENLKEHQKGKVFIGTENTHTWQVRGYYRTKTWYRDGLHKNVYKIPDLTTKEVFSHDWVSNKDRKNHKQIFNSSYDNATVRVSSRLNIALLRDTPAYAGSFRWTGYDYIGEAGYVHGGWPFKAFMGGAIDLANFEKDLYYLYQSQWTKKPMVHILPHWTHPKVEKGTEIPIWVYSNCDEVELFFNNTSLGKKTPGTIWNEMQCQWLVLWTPGELKAIGFNKGQKVTEQVIRTAKAPSQINLSIDGEPLVNKANDIVQVRVITTDDKDELYPYGENRTYFHIIGGGKIKALDNGSPIDVEKHYDTNNRIAFYGLTRAYIESTDDTSDINLLATSILGEKKLITSNAVSIDTKILNLRGNVIQPKIDVYYTTNNEEPTQKSTPYTSSFDVTLGTTVKALVVVNGKPTLTLKERFAKDEGFTWNDVKSHSIQVGEQAEDAIYNGAKIMSRIKGYNGRGYLSFLNAKNSFVEWYQENDGDATSAVINIRYTGNTSETKTANIKIIVNNKIVSKQLILNNDSWTTTKIPITLKRGANSIRIIPLTNANNLLVDEISIK